MRDVLEEFRLGNGFGKVDKIADDICLRSDIRLSYI